MSAVVFQVIIFLTQAFSLVKGFVLGYAFVKLDFNLKTQDRLSAHAGILGFSTYIWRGLFALCQAGTNI